MYFSYRQRGWLTAGLEREEENLRGRFANVLQETSARCPRAGDAEATIITHSGGSMARQAQQGLPGALMGLFCKPWEGQLNEEITFSRGTQGGKQPVG